MTGLYAHLEPQGEGIFKVSLLRFYENGYVIYRQETGDKTYLTKILKTFIMVGHDVKGEQEYTFCGAYDEYDPKLSFKVENAPSDPSNSWAPKDLIAFTGTIISPKELMLKSVTKRTQYTTERKFDQMTDQELLAKL